MIQWIVLIAPKTRKGVRSHGSKTRVALSQKHHDAIASLCVAVLLPDWLLVIGVGPLGDCSPAKDEADVLVPQRAMFDGMAHRDASAIKAPWLPGGVLVVVQSGVLSQFTVEFSPNRVATSGTTHIEERIHDPEVRIDHDLVFVWAPFNFFTDGKLDHCGRDLFRLNQKNGKWQIVALAATTRTECS